MITNKGTANNIKCMSLFVVSGSQNKINVFDDCISVVDNESKYLFLRNVITSQDKATRCQRSISSIDEQFLKSLNDGDVLSVQEDGTVNVLWKYGSEENLLFLTDYCNSRCIMCPQTNLGKSKHYYEQALKILKLVKEEPNYLCISGGEPTFLRTEYLNVVKYIKEKMPRVALQVLTNGKNYSDFEFAKNSALNSPKDTLYAIPIYSANPELHDNIVRSNGSFNKTIKGIINLYKLRQNIEIRIVITKQNFRDLLNIAHFIYWNMPFVYRIAFMGMETHGSAAENFKEVWIEPEEYVSHLNEAVQFLNNRMLNVVVYNLPYCLLPPSLMNFAQDSISTWKKNFWDECEGCTKQDCCSGMFTTSINKLKGIHKI